MSKPVFAVLLHVVLCLSFVLSSIQDPIRKQRHDLKKLGCEPKAMAVRIADYLNFSDSLADKVYFPKVVSVHRCLENLSFCGQSRFGIVTGRCKAHANDTENRPFYVIYRERNEEIVQKVLIPEHKACVCTR